jgi:hypothetical protein
MVEAIGVDTDTESQSPAYSLPPVCAVKTLLYIHAFVTDTSALSKRLKTTLAQETTVESKKCPCWEVQAVASGREKPPSASNNNMINSREADPLNATFEMQSAQTKFRPRFLNLAISFVNRRNDDLSP